MKLDADLIKANEELKVKLLKELEHNLAIAMHEALCTHNHTDGCGWHNEIRQGVHDWSNGSAHARWLGQARKMSLFCQKNHTSTDYGIVAGIQLFEFMRSKEYLS